MRHVTIRGILALIWLAAVVSGVTANLEWAGLYVLMGAAFGYSAYACYVAAAYKQKLPDVSELVRGFHFEEYTDTLLKDLSTGSRKKAFLITAFALKRPPLLLDEPVNGLDFQSTEYLYQLIAGYKEHGTILFSSHILESITL